MQHIVHIFVGDDLTSFRDLFAAEFRRLHPGVEQSLFSALSLTIGSDNELVFSPDRNGDRADAAHVADADGNFALRNYFEDIYRRKVTVAHPGNRSLVLVIWAKLYRDDVAPTIERLVAGAVGCESNVIVEIAGFTHDAVSCFIADPLQRLSPDVYRDAFRANIEVLRPLRPGLAALRLIANRNMDNVSLDLDEESMARVCAEHSALMCEHYLTLRASVVDPREYPFETFGISSILFDIEYFRSYIRGRVVIDRLRSQGVGNRSFSINALAARTNPVLNRVIEKIREFHDTRAAHARASLALSGSDSASNIAGSVDSGLKSIISDLRRDIAALLSSGEISIFESEALMALILGDDSAMFDSSAVSADETTIEDIIDESASFFCDLAPDDYGKLAEVSLDDIKKLREAMRNIAVANRRRSERLAVISAALRDASPASPRIEGRGYRFEGTDYRLDLDIDSEPLPLTYEPGAAPADSVDLRGIFTPVRDQGRQGCSASFAVASVIEAMRRDSKRYSPAFLYWSARQSAGNADSDSGASINEILREASANGVCPEEKMPYNPDIYALAPSDEAARDAALCKVLEARSVAPRVRDIKSALTEGYPVIVAARIFDSFSDTAKGFVTHPSPDELADDSPENQARHAMVVCGFSDKERVFVVRNSWGTAFGDNGYCYIPYSYAAKYFLQACVITKVTEASGAGSRFDCRRTLNFNLGDKSIEAAVLRNLIEEDQLELDSLTADYGLKKMDWAQNVAALCNANIQAEIVALRQERLDERVSRQNSIIADLQKTKNDKLRDFKIYYLKWLLSTGAMCLISWGCVAIAKTELWTWIAAALATLVFVILLGAFSFNWRNFRQNLRDEILGHAANIDRVRMEKTRTDIQSHIHGSILRDVEDYRLALSSDYQTLCEFNRAWIELYDKTVERVRAMSPAVPYPFLAVLDNRLLDRYYTAWKEKMDKALDFKTVYAKFATNRGLEEIVESDEALNSAVVRGLKNFSMKEYVTLSQPGKWQFLPDSAKISEVIPDLDARATPFCPYDAQGDDAVEKYIFVKDINRDDMNGILPYFSKAPMAVAGNDPYSISILNVVRYNLP
ncbi:MAG: C1 family peptidase [[Clostridium] fimetarium]|nr:C1 family peptidase [Alistipes timonensis]MCM1405700.1 C1 family peptidase [[Clostridium] fimetarium]